MGYGKTKGNQFERAICHKLSMWVSDGATKDIFWRSASSGGRATQRTKRDGERMKVGAGDISAVDRYGHYLLELFTIECKFYKDAGYSKMVVGLPIAFTDFWRQAVTSCVGTEPMLIVKENRRDEMLFTTKAGFRLLKRCSKRGLTRTVIWPGVGAHGIMLRNLLVRVNYKKLVKIAKVRRKKLLAKKKEAAKNKIVPARVKVDTKDV